MVSAGRGEYQYLSSESACAGWVRGEGQGYGCAPQELTQEVYGRTPLLPAGPPHRHQYRLRPCPRPGPAAASDLAENDAEADGQLGPPIGGGQPRLPQERDQVVAMSPQVLGQALVGRVRLGREDQVAQLVLQPTAGYGQAVPADLSGRVTVPQVEPRPWQLGNSPRNTDRGDVAGDGGHGWLAQNCAYNRHPRGIMA
jgi:hypothetical protein